MDEEITFLNDQNLPYELCQDPFCLLPLLPANFVWFALVQVLYVLSVTVGSYVYEPCVSEGNISLEPFTTFGPYNLSASFSQIDP